MKDLMNIVSKVHQLALVFHKQHRLLAYFKWQLENLKNWFYAHSKFVQTYSVFIVFCYIVSFLRVMCFQLNFLILKKDNNKRNSEVELVKSALKSFEKASLSLKSDYSTFYYQAEVTGLSFFSYVSCS